MRIMGWSSDVCSSDLVTVTVHSTYRTSRFQALRSKINALSPYWHAATGARHGHRSGGRWVPDACRLRRSAPECDKGRDRRHWRLLVVISSGYYLGQFGAGGQRMHIGIIDEGRLSEIPKRHWAAHEFCFHIHVLIANLTRAVEESGASNVSIKIRDEEAVEAFRNRSEEHTSELQSLMRNSYAVFYL